MTRNESHTLLYILIFLIQLFVSESKAQSESSAVNDPIIYCSTSDRIEISPGTTQRLAIAPTGVVCTLTRVNGKYEVAPVGRSYNNYHWEAVAGPYANLSYNDCNDESCRVVIPEISNEGDIFYLTGFEVAPLSKSDETARFLEQVSFGVTHSDLTKMRESSSDDLLPYFTQWVYEQSYEVQLSSHRATWRRKTAPIFQSDGVRSREGRAVFPCEEGSLWRGYAFTPHDQREFITVEMLNGRYALKVNGIFRTMVDNFRYKDSTDEIDVSQEIEICFVQAGISNTMSIYYDDVTCMELEGGNPQLSIQGMEPQPERLYGLKIGKSRTNGISSKIEMMRIKKSIKNGNCKVNDENKYTTVDNGISMQDLIFEPRLVLQGNVLKHPLKDGGRKIIKMTSNNAQCINSPRTFLNEKDCRLSKQAACTVQDSAISGLVTLGAKTLKKLYKQEKVYAYAILKLRLDGDSQSPCIHGVRSRWVKEEISNNTCVQNVYDGTATIFGEILLQSNDTNHYVRDVYLPLDKKCLSIDDNKVAMQIKIGDQCWKTVHPDHMNVYDFSEWVNLHPGGANKIKGYAKRKKHKLRYPAHHLMSRWEAHRDSFPFLGRLGDSVQFKYMPDYLRTLSFAQLFGLVTKIPDKNSTVICGSPYEVENDSRSLAPSFNMQHLEQQCNNRPKGYCEQQKSTIWTMISTSSNDQLRQRVAWALSQLLAISPQSVLFPVGTESFLAYYDIFVRNAMGNYKDVLREVAFSPLMAQMLSYLNSRSSEFTWKSLRQIQFADENFAREIMQLFSIGLVELNTDGTTKLDSNGNSIYVYTNDDIQEYARLWTGFRRQSQRGNTEERGVGINDIDPMAIQIEWRDQFPKMGLDGKYVGDEYALCSDLPSNVFLQKGAKYRLLGYTTYSDVQNIQEDLIIPRLDESSVLAAQLCQRDSNKDCSYPGVVNLPQNLTCNGIECSLSEIPKIIQLEDNLFYEHISPPCVHFPFSKSGDTNIMVDKNGKIAIVEDDYLLRPLDSLTFFRVQWQGDFPRKRNSCADGFCRRWSGRCICRTSVNTAKVFDSEPTRDEVLSQLHIGAMSPNFYQYKKTETFPSFKIYYEIDTFDINSAFQVKDDSGRTLYLKNMKSNVVIQHWNKDSHSVFGFRNTPTFYGDVAEVQDALYETEAGLDHYFYHRNIGPFLALRLIQRFGISNPSPRFVQTVAQAFKSGKFEVADTRGLPSFGNGEYGDLSATIAAIVLDRESRDVSLDFDPSYGSIREPIIKVISLLRSMDYTQTDGHYMSLYNLDSIGQQAHELPSVFSFFLPEYVPPGPVAKASLVAPEAMILHNSIGLLNGMLSLMKFGMTYCNDGFGKEPDLGGSIDCISTGNLSYFPKKQQLDNADFVVKNLATMLTSGRLSRFHRNIVKEAYLSETDRERGFQLAQELIILSPEFHVTAGASRKAAKKRLPMPPVTKVCKRYKTVVHILLKGGCDSFNLLVPHSQCQGKDLYDEYKNERGPIALEKEDLLPISAETSDQICSSFGIHPSLPVLQKLYDEKEAAFLAGIGILSAPVNTLNYMEKTKTILFAHNTAQAEISRLDPFMKAISTGTLGRLSDVLLKGNNIVNAFSVDSTLAALGGKEDGITKIAVNSEVGLQLFNPSAKKNDIVSEQFDWMNGEQESISSLFAETWSSSLHESISLSEQLIQAQNSVKSNTIFPDTDLGRQLSFVSKMIGSKDCRGSSRDIFFIETGAFDHHARVMDGLKYEFDNLNEGLEVFINEIKSLPDNVWDDVVIAVSSDFGRTLTPNSEGGSDHGWSGNSFMIGGSINGGKILGEYLDDLTSSNPLNLGRGRFIPTMPFEAPWNAVIQWLGITNDDEIDEILPNRGSFPEAMLLNKNDLFVEKESSVNECNSNGQIASCANI